MFKSCIIFLKKENINFIKNKEKRDKMSIRTDLAAEREEIKENHISSIKKIGKISILKAEEKEEKYITIQFHDILKEETEELSEIIINVLEEFINKKIEKVFVVGLGNPDMISDAIGVKTAKKILATRHITSLFKNTLELKNLKSVAVLTPDVLGNTGIETAEIIKAAAKKIEPDLILVIDALAAKSPDRLFKTIQITNNGISPGSGVKNSRKEISEKTIGFPVLAIGVPTVVDANSIAFEISGKDLNYRPDLVVTPKDVDLLTEKLSEILSYSINISLQPDTDREIILDLV